MRFNNLGEYYIWLSNLLIVPKHKRFVVVEYVEGDKYNGPVYIQTL